LKFCSLMGSLTFSRRAVVARCRRGRGMGGQDGLRADADAWHLCCITLWRGRLLTTGHPPPSSILLLLAGERVVWGWGGRAGCGGGGPGRGPTPAVWRSAAVLRLCWPPSPCRGAVRWTSSVAGGVAGAGSRRRHMPRSRWRLAIGGLPDRRPPRRRASPAPFFLADCGGLSVGWVSCWTLSVGWRSCCGRGVTPH